MRTLVTPLRRELRAGFALVLSFALTTACGPKWQSIATALADDDKDGWFTDTTNVAVTLTLASGSFSMLGDYAIIVDEVRFPLAPNLEGRFPVPVTQIGATVSLGNTPVAVRTRGVTGFGVTGTPFSATVRVVRHIPLVPSQIVGTVTVPFGEAPGALAPVVVGGGILGSATLNFSVGVASFRDPSPTDSTGDVDADGIPEVAEARLTSRFAGVFDPRAGGRDIDLIIGTTSSSFTLDSLSRELMKSRFRVSGFMLHLDEGALAGASGDGGLMNLAGSGASPTDTVNTAQAFLIRNANVPASRRRFAYFTLIAGDASIGGGSRAFGVANGIPGSTLVMRNGPVPAPTIVPPITWYQSGVLMHELGHLLGLCHPTQSTGVAPCLAIPVGERSAGASVMGSPAEDPNIIISAINTLRRPLDYTATQWTQLRLGAGFAP